VPAASRGDFVTKSPLDRRNHYAKMGGVPIRGVLFDWRGTFVRDPDEIVRRLQAASKLRVVSEAQDRADCSAELHRNAAMLWYGEADLEPEIAEALYLLDREAIAHPMFEDVPETLEGIKALGVGIAIVSDIHFDLRPESPSWDLTGWSTTSSTRSSMVCRSPILESSHSPSICSTYMPRRLSWSATALLGTAERSMWESPRCCCPRSADRCGDWTAFSPSSIRHLRSPTSARTQMV
jgi:hypothetical protein